MADGDFRDLNRRKESQLIQQIRVIFSRRFGRVTSVHFQA